MGKYTRGKYQLEILGLIEDVRTGIVESGLYLTPDCPEVKRVEVVRNDLGNIQVIIVYRKEGEVQDD